MREREALARDGFILVNLRMDKDTCNLVEEPEIITRGFIYARNGDSLLDSARELVLEAVRCGKDSLETDLEQSLRSFFYNRTKRRPMVFVTMSWT
jgi:ribonuclease J